MPGVKLAGLVALDLVAHVLERALEEREGLAQLGQRGADTAEEQLIHVLPLLAPADHQVHGLLDLGIQTLHLADPARNTLAMVSSLLLLLQVISMRWNVVIGGQLLSKSYRGTTSYLPGLMEKEGLLAAAIIGWWLWSIRRRREQV